jgi:hypothetical protein
MNKLLLVGVSAVVVIAGIVAFQFYQAYGQVPSTDRLTQTQIELHTIVKMITEIGDLAVICSDHIQAQEYNIINDCIEFMHKQYTDMKQSMNETKTVRDNIKAKEFDYLDLPQ